MNIYSYIQNKVDKNFCQHLPGWILRVSCLWHTCFDCTCVHLKRKWLAVRDAELSLLSILLWSCFLCGGNALYFIRNPILFRLFSLWTEPLFSSDAALHKHLKASQPFRLLQNSSTGSETSNKAPHCCVPIGPGRGSSCQWSVFLTEEQSAEAACSFIQPHGCPGRQAGRPAARSQQAKFNSHASKHW